MAASTNTATPTRVAQEDQRRSKWRRRSLVRVRRPAWSPEPRLRKG